MKSLFLRMRMVHWLGVDHFVGQTSRTQSSARANAEAAAGIIDNADRMARLSDELDSRLARFQT